MGSVKPARKPVHRGSAKLSRPTPSGALYRQRLFQRLDQGRTQPVIWLSGPAGSGKTTLVSSYIQARDLACLWYQIDCGDADLATFFYYLGLAGRKAAPSRRTGLPRLTSEYLQGIPRFSLNFFEDLFERMKSSSILVFDNYQDVPDDAPLHEALLQGLTRIPGDETLILVSRSDPPPPFARLRANQQMELLGWDELRLTLEEFDEIVCQREFGGQPEEVLRHLYDKMEGWAAGLQLLLETAARESLSPKELVEGTLEEIFDYFAGEIFDRLDQKTQEFLLRTSFLPRMTPYMAETLTGHTGADRLLSFLHRQNYFTERRGRTRPVYQYHPLFREFLSDRSRQAWTSEEKAEIQRRAAAQLVQSDQPEDAACLLREAKDWDGLTKLITASGRSLAEQGRGRILERWLRGMPDEIVANTPWLLYWLGVCRMPFDPMEAREDFERAFHLFRKEGKDRAGLLLAWSGAVDSILYGLEDFAEADPWIARLDEVAGGPQTVPPGEVRSRVVASMFAALVMRQPQHDDFDSWEENALEVARDTHDLNVRAQILAHAVFSKCYLGDSGGAQMVLEALKKAVQSSAAGPLSRIRSLFVEVFFCNTYGSFERACQLVQKGLDLASASGVHAMDFMLLSSGVRGALNRDDLSHARSLLDRMVTLPLKTRRWNECFHHYLSAALALREGHLERASRRVDLAVDLATSVGVCYAQAASHLLKAEVAHERGGRDSELTHLAQATQIAARNRYAQLLLNCSLAEAKFAFDRGADAEGLGFLRQGFALGKEKGALVPYICRAPVLIELCTKALQCGIEVGYAQTLIRKCGLAPACPPLEIENWPWPLKIYTLGRFELVLDGRSIRFSKKAQQKPLTLLKALIAFGGRKVSESRLADELWPDVDGYLAHRSFVTNLSRLRRLLGVKEVLRFRDGRLTLDDRYCWVDTWALERLLGQAGAARKEGTDVDDAVVAHRIEKASDLYQGAFLPQDVDAPWALHYRERLRSKFLRAMESWGERLEGAHQFKKAAHHYERVLDVEPSAEEFYRRLMVCYERSGRKAEALSVYRRCREILSRTLGVEPSDDTEAVRRRCAPNPPAHP